MSPVLTKHFSELSTREYHRIVQAREAVFFLEQHITEPDADAVDPQSVFMWMEDGGRVVAFLRIIPAGIGSLFFLFIHLFHLCRSGTH